MHQFDEKYRLTQSHLLCGVDEAGRGPIAGPVVAAAIMLPPGIIIEGINDSKKLTASTRDHLYGIIINN